MVDEARLPTMTVGHPYESIKGHNQIGSLCDELLTEILIRLPTYKFVIQCMCVCKRWASMASHPCFIPKFISLKFLELDNGVINFNEEHTFATVMQYAPDRYCRLGQGFDSLFRPTILNPQESSLSPLSSYLGDDIDSVSIGKFASCKDLLLYGKHDNVKYDYYLCNIQTKQCVVLPSLPHHSGKVNLVGFICNAFFCCDREVVMNLKYHYSVVVIRCTPRPSTKFNAHIFSSHCGSQWCDRVLSFKKACILQPSGFSFCFDGKLHFSCLQGFFGLDLSSLESNDEIECHLVEWPIGMLQGNHRLGVSQENLYLSVYCLESLTLWVWVLEDYKEGNWLLKHRVETQEWVSRYSWMAKKIKKYSCQRVLGLNPSCSDVIYVVVPHCVFLCNLETKMVEWVCETPIAKYKNYLNNFYAFPLVYQIVPTPLPCLANGLKDGVDAPPPSGSRL